MIQTEINDHTKVENISLKTSKCMIWRIVSIQHFVNIYCLKDPSAKINISSITSLGLEHPG